jgi:hypothetical protein
MNELLHHPLQEEDWIAILLIAIVVGFVGLQCLKAVLAHVRQSREHDADVTLKMEMIQRGMAAVEIERVLASKSDLPYQARSLLNRVGTAAKRMMERAFDRA